MRHPCTLRLTYEMAQALHSALYSYLHEHSIRIIGETVIGEYADGSQLDRTVRLSIRLNRYLLGGQANYNCAVEYRGQAVGSELPESTKL